jgi:hypothetical protein
MVTNSGESFCKKEVEVFPDADVLFSHYAQETGQSKHFPRVETTNHNYQASNNANFEPRVCTALRVRFPSVEVPGSEASP